MSSRKGIATFRSGNSAPLFPSKKVLLERLAVIHRAGLEHAGSDATPWSIDPNSHTTISLKHRPFSIPVGARALTDSPSPLSGRRSHFAPVDLGVSGAWFPFTALSSINGSGRSDRASTLRLRHKWTSDELFQLRGFDLSTAGGFYSAEALTIRKGIARRLADKPAHTTALATLRMLLLLVAYREDVSITTRDGSSFVISPGADSGAAGGGYPTGYSLDRVYSSGGAAARV